METQTNKGAPPPLQHVAGMHGEDLALKFCDTENLLSLVERLLRERLQEDQQRIDEDPGDTMQDEVEASQVEASSLSVQQGRNNGKAFWLTHFRGVGAADASAALECLHVVRECVALQPAAEAGSDSSWCLVRIPVYLYTLLECICHEAAAAKNNDTYKHTHEQEDASAASAASRITGGLALLLVVLLQQFSPEALHKTVHSDPKFFILLLKAIDACSIFEKTTAKAATRASSPRPLLLLLTSVQQCFSVYHPQQQAEDISSHSPNHNGRYSHSSSSNSSSSSLRGSSGTGTPADGVNVCSCFPARGVWKQLLQSLTSDARALVRHRARQTAQLLFYVAATKAGGAAPISETAEREASGSAVVARDAFATSRLKRQHHARASVVACLSELQKYLGYCEALSAGERFCHHEERLWQKTRFVRVLPFVRRVLASLLLLPLTSGSTSHHENISSSNYAKDEKGYKESRDDAVPGSSIHAKVDWPPLLKYAERCARAHQTLLLAVRDICMQTAFLNKTLEHFSVEVAQGVRCVVDAVAEALQQHLQRCEKADFEPHKQQQQQQQRDRLENDSREAQHCGKEVAGNLSSSLDVGNLLVLPVATQLLSGLLQQQYYIGTNTNSRDKGSGKTLMIKETAASSTSSEGLREIGAAAEVVSSSIWEKRKNNTTAAVSEAVAQASGTTGTAGAAEYAAAWCAGVSVALEVLTRWTGVPRGGDVFPHEEANGSGSKAHRHKHSALASQQKSFPYGGESSNVSRRDGGGDGAYSEDEMKETDLLFEQLQRLSLLPQGEEGTTCEETPVDKDTRRTNILLVRRAQTAAPPANSVGERGRQTRRAADGGAGVADALAEQPLTYARRAELFSLVWRRVLKCLCEGLAVVRDSSVATALAAAGRRLIEQATLLELPLLDAAVPYCMALLHYKQKQHWREALQQSAQLFNSFESVALKQYSRGSPCFPQLQRLASTALRPQTHRHGQQQQHQNHEQIEGQQEGGLADYMDAYADLYREAFEPLLERIVTMLSIVETGGLPDNSSNNSKRFRDKQDPGVYSTSRAEDAEDSRERLASLQRRDMAVHRGDLRCCFAAALHAFACRVLLSKRFLPLVFFMEVSDLSQTDLLVFDERAAAALAAESCRICSSGRSRSVEWCSNSWLLPLLPGCLKRDRLALFAAYFYPIAQQLHQQARHAFTLGKPVQARELCRLQQQVWGLLPGFCCQPLDLIRALSTRQGSMLFDTMLQLLHEPVLRQDICASIANLCAAVAVPPCAAAGAAAVAASGGSILCHGDSPPPETSSVQGRAFFETASASASSGQGELVAALALEARRGRAAAIMAVLRYAVHKGCSSSLTDDEGVTALAAVAGSGCYEGRRLLQQRAAPVIGFLVVRYLQVHKLPTVGPGGLAGATGSGTATRAASQQQRSFLAAMLLGEKESLEHMTQSAKMKAAQHLLRAITAYAPLCPKGLLNVNVRRFTSAFLNRATTAAVALGASASVSPASAETTKAPAASVPAPTAVLGPTEAAALVDITDALLPVLSEEFTVELIYVLRNLLEICMGGLKKHCGPQPGAAEKGKVACNAVELLVHRQVLQVLLRRAYKTLKHILERSLEQLRQLSLQQELRQPHLHQQPRLLSKDELPSSGKQPSTVVRKESTPVGENDPFNCVDVLHGGVGAPLLSPQLLMELWKVLEPGRAISWIASAEKARLGCLRVFVCHCLAAQAHAERAARTGIKSSFNSLTQDSGAGAARQKDDGSAAEWGALLEKSLLPVLVPEILLCLKTPNRVVRDTALDALSTVAEACEDDREKLSGLVIRVAAGLGGCNGGDLPLMKAAAALALSRLILFFSEELGKNLVNEVAEVVLVMLEDDSTPVFLGALHFTKVLVQVLDADQLEVFLPTILNLFESTAVARVSDSVFCACGLGRLVLYMQGDAIVEAAFPKKHMPLLRHVQRRLRKQQLRKLLCSAALQEGLSWEDLDFGMGSSSNKEETEHPAKRCTKQSASRHFKQRFADILDEEEDDDDDESEQEEEKESGGRLDLRKSLRKKDVLSSKGKRKGSHNESATEEKDKQFAARGVQPGGVVSVYLRGMPDAVEGAESAERPRGKKRTRGQASAGPVSLTEDHAGDTPVDLLSPAAAERIVLSKCMRKCRQQEIVQMDGSTALCGAATRDAAAHPSKEEEVYWDEEGRLVIVDAKDRNSTHREKSGAFAKIADAKRLTNTRARRPVGDKEGEILAEKKRPTLSSLAARRAEAKAAKQQKRGGHFVQQGGEAFRSKKARGDVRRNKKVEPFAYIRLNPAMIREKYRPKALKSLSTVLTKPSRRKNIAAASRGVQKKLQGRSRGRKT